MIALIVGQMGQKVGRVVNLVGKIGLSLLVGVVYPYLINNSKSALGVRKVGDCPDGWSNRTTGTLRGSCT